MTKLLAGICLALVLAGCGAPRPPTELERYKVECRNRGAIDEHDRREIMDGVCHFSVH